jgi:CHAT domain-containing protein
VPSAAPPAEGSEAAARLRADALVDAPETPLRWPVGNGTDGDAHATADADALALAWALKARCYEAWSTAPARVAPAADRLQALAALAAAAASPVQTLLAALAAWTRGIALLVEGRMADAAAQLQAAHDAFIAGGDAQHAAETRVPRVVALSLAGQAEAALACAEEALAQFIASGDERSAGKVELNLGSMLSRQDRHAEAAAHYRRAALRFARVGAIEHSVMADIGLANALTWLFDTDEALLVHQRARQRAAQHGFSLLQAQAQIAIGRIALHRGQAQLALSELVQASALLQAQGAAPQQRLEAEAALADAYAAVPLLPEAVALYDRVVEIASAIGADTELARALLDRARAQSRLGQAGPARQALLRAQALFVAAGNAAAAAGTELGLGALQLQTGEAEAACRSAEQARQALAGSGILLWQLEAGVLRAAALAALQRPLEAEGEYRAVLQAAGDLPRLQLLCFLGLAEGAQAAGQRALAQQHLEAALAAIDRARAALPGDEFRSAAGADAERATDLLLALALDDHAADPAAVFAAMERGRARALQLALGAAPGAAERDVAPDPASERCAERLRWTRERWREAAAAGDDAVTLAALARQQQALEAELLEAHRRATLQARALASTSASAQSDVADLADGQAGAPSPAGGELLARLQSSLADDTAWVEYHRLGDRLAACVVTRDGVHHRDWAVPELDARLQALRFQLDSQRSAAPALAAHAPLLLRRVQQHLQALHRLLWAPLQPLLQGRPQLVLVPHRALHYVPFAALHDGGQWLVQQHALSLAASAAVWLQQPEADTTPPRTVLAVGVDPGATDPADPELAALPSVAGELAAVAAVFGARATVLRDAAATQAAVRAAAGQADLLHLACHGRFRADSPYFSALSLSDGPLTVHALQAWRLQARLVVLSACETGISRVAPGDELLGLVRGFTLAGARSVLASLWAVDDAATASLMRALYRGLAAGLPPARALQRAQAAAAGAGAHPFHWAAMALHGRG